MKTESNRSTVLVVYDTNQRYDLESVRRWFAESSLNIDEASDFFDAIERISDMTIQSSPDVVLLKLHPGTKASALISQFNSALDGFDLSLAVLSDAKDADEKRKFNFGSLTGLKYDLDSQNGPILGCETV